jgi:hypothetical protein
MEALRSANLALRFILELLAVVALGCSLRSDLRPIWSEVGSCMVDSVGAYRPTLTAASPLLWGATRSDEGPPPWWAGNPLPRH